MTQGRPSYPRDRETRAVAHAWAEIVKAGFAEPRHRERRRPSAEAAWLARNGTPARLIGHAS